MILVLGFGIICGIMGARMSKLQTEAVENMSYYHNVTNSHTIASAGANSAMSIIYQDPTKRGAITSQSFSAGEFKGGSFSSRIDSLPSTKLRLRTVSDYHHYSDTVEVYFNTQRINSFSMFAWLTNFEGGVFWITGDTVWGRVHSNGVLNVNGRPTFYEKVTTAKLFAPKPGVGTNKAIFKKGYETGVARLEFPTDLSELSNAALAGGRRYTTNVYLSLSAGSGADDDGKVYVRTSSGGPVVDSISVADPGFNGAIWSTQSVYVEGKVDGRITIGAANDIHVTNDITYEVNPLNDVTSNDMLGLVANAKVFVDDNAANNANCEIHASIFSRAGSFTAQNYLTRPVSGTLKIVGGIVQDTRGAVGTFAGSTIVSGFSKRYYYDPRLADAQVRPPFFPGFYTQTLTISNWWENVRIPEYF
ncbi:MAG TPA: hypothetical protein VI932_10930 [Bacteroidota bacterium]|nr:hypothetical protein [Bacteroidota bacterium]